MLRLAAWCVLVAAAAAAAAGDRPARAYAGDPQLAAIVQEQRYLSGDGTFGAAYEQEDGIAFREESDAAGNRRGTYSYVDPGGVRRTVAYTAGKDGFQASGDHLPAAPAAPVPAPAAPAARPAPLGPLDEDDGQYRPELYEREYSAAPAPTRYAAPAPAPAQYAAPAPAPAQYAAPAPAQYAAPASAPAAPQYLYPGTQQAQYSGLPSPAAAPLQPRYYSEPAPATPAPHRFFPPGKFNLDRSPDGYLYTFSQQ